MANKRTRSLFHDNIIAIIVGNGISAHVAALRLDTELGISSVLCGKRENLLNTLNFKCGFFQLDFRSNPRLAAEQLIYLTEINEDFTHILIPTSENAARFVSDNSELLESRYITVPFHNDPCEIPMLKRTCRTVNER